MKKLIYSVLVVLFVCSCNESYINKLNHESEIVSVQTFTYELTDNDYSRIVNIDEAKAFALENDTNAFNNIGKNKSFADQKTARRYLPYFLKYNMPYLSEGSEVTILYRQDRQGSKVKDTVEMTFTCTNNSQWIPIIIYLAESFINTQGRFSIQNVSIQDGFSNPVWTSTAEYGMKATAYIASSKTNYATESWLISPSMDLSEAVDPIISFEQASQYMRHSTDSLTYKERLALTYLVLVSKDYEDNVSTAHWDTVPYLKDEKNEYRVPDGSNWDFVPTGELDLSSVIGAEKVTVAFRYLSTSLAAGTWEIKNVKVRERME